MRTKISIRKALRIIFMKLKQRIFDPEFKEFYIHEYGVRKCLRGTHFSRRGTQIVLVIAYTAIIEQ